MTGPYGGGPAVGIIRRTNCLRAERFWPEVLLRDRPLEMLTG
jgi:hypothetical protein